MSQPVVDTLELCDALRRTGMETEQAEGVARALGKELGQHVVTQGDLQVGFGQVRSEIQAARAETGALRAETQAGFQQARAETQAAFQQARAETQAAFQQARAEIQAVDHKVDLVRSDLGGRIESLHATVKTTLTGVALAIAFLALVTGVGIFRTGAPGTWDTRAPSVSVPPPATVETALPNE